MPCLLRPKFGAFNCSLNARRIASRLSGVERRDVIYPADACPRGFKAKLVLVYGDAYFILVGTLAGVRYPGIERNIRLWRTAFVGDGRAVRAGGFGGLG